MNKAAGIILGALCALVVVGVASAASLVFTGTEAGSAPNVRYAVFQSETFGGGPANARILNVSCPSVKVGGEDGVIYGYYNSTSPIKKNTGIGKVGYLTDWPVRTCTAFVAMESAPNTPISDVVEFQIP
jgi:hypothetical protein